MKMKLPHISSLIKFKFILYEDVIDKTLFEHETFG